MSKDWCIVKEEIEKELDKIFWEEPEEVTMSKLGIFPSGAGVDGQVLGNWYFLLADTQGLGWCCTDLAMQAAINDSTFTVEQCKTLWKALTVNDVKLMGDKYPPKCPVSWLNVPKLWKFCQDIVEAFDTVETKEEFADLIWSWKNYVNRLNRWFCLVFPWHLGKMFQRIEKKDIEELARLNDKAIS